MNAARCAGLALLLLATAICTRAQDKSDLTQSVVSGCIYQVGEFGEAAVQMCIRTELAAAAALEAYPPQVRPIVDRCSDAYAMYGYGMIENCVKRELAAAKESAGTQ